MKTKSKEHRVWIDFGDGEPQEFGFPTLEQLNAFLQGIDAASQAWGIDDYRQFDTAEEAEQDEGYGPGN